MLVGQLLRFVFLFLVLFLFLACPAVKPPTPPVSAPPEPPDPILTRPFVYVEGSRFMFQGEELRFKGVNYFPVKQNWRNMWLNWDAAAIEKEITLLRGLGVTVVRVFIPGRDFKDSEMASPAASSPARLIRRPLESFSMDLLYFTELLKRWRCVFRELTLVLMRSPIVFPP